MRLAWFAATSLHAPGPADDTALLVRSLRARHTIEVIHASRAHDFVWQHARNPFDLCIFELGGTAAHRFIPPYAVHFPGIVLLRGLPRHDRALQASRLVVVPHEPVAQAIADDYRCTRVRTLVPGVEPLPDDVGEVISALRWPPDGAALTHAMAGFAARRAVIVFDGPETADWPSLDPQNWETRAPFRSLPRRPGAPKPRAKAGPAAPKPEAKAGSGDAASADPICVSIDPRDEAHSLRLALRRLEQDATLRARLGAAAYAWWREHATVELASAGFETLLEEARALPDVVTDGEDGTGVARRILDEFGLGASALGLGSVS